MFAAAPAPRGTYGATPAVYRAAPAPAVAGQAPRAPQAAAQTQRLMEPVAIASGAAPRLVAPAAASAAASAPALAARVVVAPALVAEPAARFGAASELVRHASGAPLQGCGGAQEHAEVRLAQAEALLEQSRDKEAALAHKLGVATAAMECLGQEADQECDELQAELHSKQAELDEALAELASWRSGSTSGQTVWQELQDARQTCEALRRELRGSREEAREALRGSTRDAEVVQALQQRAAECDQERAALAAEACALEGEARRLEALEESSLRTRSVAIDALASEVAAALRRAQPEGLPGAAAPPGAPPGGVRGEVASLRGQLAGAEESISKRVTQNAPLQPGESVGAFAEVESLGGRRASR